MRASDHLSRSAVVVRSVSAVVVAVVVAVPILAGLLWWPQDAPSRRSTPPATFPADDLARYASLAPDVALPGPVVLAYHDISPQVDAARPYDVTPAAFEEQMAMLDAAGFESITVDQLLAHATGAALPPRSVLITFDDGIKGIWTWADRILERHGFTAVAFVITGSVGANTQYYLGWEDLLDMHATGRWDIESHTHAGHRMIPSGPDGASGPFLLTRAWLPTAGRIETFAEWEARVEADLDTSIAELVEAGLPSPSLFAPPFAAVDEPTNDPAIPAALRRLLDERFAASVVNRPDAELVASDEIASRLVRRVEVRASTTTFQLFERIAGIVASSAAA